MKPEINDLYTVSYIPLYVLWGDNGGTGNSQYIVGLFSDWKSADDSKKDKGFWSDGRVESDVNYFVNIDSDGDAWAIVNNKFEYVYKTSIPQHKANLEKIKNEALNKLSIKERGALGLL